ncbi:MAG: hypothetical protein QXR53_03560 [Candidatus Norongarragalinales archaeon]
MKVLMDTNVLLAFLDNKTDFAGLIKETYLYAELYVLKQSMDEIKAKRKAAFRHIEEYVKNNGFRVVGGSGKADGLIESWAKANNGVVATRDFALKKRLKRAGIQVISLKNNKLGL